jgi:hypothetical protein
MPVERLKEGRDPRLSSTDDSVHLHSQPLTSQESGRRPARLSDEVNSSDEMRSRLFLR